MCDVEAVTVVGGVCDGDLKRSTLTRVKMSCRDKQSCVPAYNVEGSMHAMMAVGTGMATLAIVTVMAMLEMVMIKKIQRERRTNAYSHPFKHTHTYTHRHCTERSSGSGGVAGVRLCGRATIMTTMICNDRHCNDDDNDDMQ